MTTNSTHTPNGKLNLYVDFDDTMARSSAAVVNILNKKYNINPPKTEFDHKDWTFYSICPQTSKEEISQIFASDEFFATVELNPVFVDFYNTHKESFNWYVVTKGTKENLTKKKNYIESRLGTGLTFIGLEHDVTGGVGDKSCVDMRGGIQIDDSMTCLRSSATVKILIRNHRELPWNKVDANIDNLYVTQDWREVVEILEYALVDRDFVKECY